MGVNGLKWYFLVILNEYPSGLMTKGVTGNRRYIRFPLYSHQIWTVEWSYQPITGRFFSSFVISPPRESFVKGWKRGSKDVLFVQNWGQIFRRSVEVRTLVRIQKVIWDHLLASKKEASFLFACGTPRSEWLSPCYVVWSVFVLSRMRDKPKNVSVGGYSWMR